MPTGVIYSIVCNETGEVYYGSTTKTVEERIQQHRWDCATWKNGGKKNYCSSYKIIERNNYNVNEVECVEYEQKQQLREREKYWVENNSCINLFSPLLTKEELTTYYNERNRTERKKDTNRIWRESNKDILREKKRLYDIEYRKKKKEKSKNGREPPPHQQLYESQGVL